MRVRVRVVDYPSALWRLRRGFDSRTRTLRRSSPPFLGSQHQENLMPQVTKAGFRVVTKPAEKHPSERQLTDYREHRERFIDWMMNIGKDPDHGEGYAYDTANSRAYRLDKFYRYVRTEQEERYTTEITHDHARRALASLARIGFSGDRGTQGWSRSASRVAVAAAESTRRSRWPRDDRSPWRASRGSVNAVGRNDLCRKTQPHVSHHLPGEYPWSQRRR